MTKYRIAQDHSGAEGLCLGPHSLWCPGEVSPHPPFDLNKQDKGSSKCDLLVSKIPLVGKHSVMPPLCAGQKGMSCVWTGAGDRVGFCGQHILRFCPALPTRSPKKTLKNRPKECLPRILRAPPPHPHPGHTAGLGDCAITFLLERRAPGELEPPDLLRGSPEAPPQPHPFHAFLGGLLCHVASLVHVWWLPPALGPPTGDACVPESLFNTSLVTDPTICLSWRVRK